MDRRLVGHCVSGDHYGEGSDITVSTCDLLRRRERRGMISAMRMKGAIAGITLLTCSRRTRHAELLRLCARIGYSPPLPS
jgi:hypothetical protein